LGSILVSFQIRKEINLDLSLHRLIFVHPQKIVFVKEAIVLIMSANRLPSVNKILSRFWRWADNASQEVVTTCFGGIIDGVRLVYGEWFPSSSTAHPADASGISAKVNRLRLPYW
jgi:hypothetical protein